MTHDENSLLQRLTDAVFGNGREGLVQTVARVESQQSTILRIAQDTNEAVHQINGTVAELVVYRDQLPAKDRNDLITAVEQHLKADTEHKAWWKNLSTRVILAVIGLTLGALQLIVLARVFGIGGLH